MQVSQNCTKLIETIENLQSLVTTLKKDVNRHISKTMSPHYTITSTNQMEIETLQTTQITLSKLLIP